MTTRSSLVSALALCLLAVGGAGCGSSMGATPGGAQDNGLAQTQVNNGQVPKPEAFTVEGLLNQYDLPLESAACAHDLCIDAAYGVAPVLIENRSAVFVQIGFSSGIDAATFHRLPLNLSVVVDRSGSMSEASKLDSVKQALYKLIDQLDEGDRLSIVLFDDRVDVLVEPSLVTDRTKLKNAVAGIYARNATNMAAGLRQGSVFVQANAGQVGISDRVMVFTDALTNTGDTDQSTFIQIAASNAALNIGITLFGVGTDLNQELVLAITGMRGGNYFFLQSAAKIATVFDTDFDYLVTPLAYDLNFQLLPATGFVITAVYGFPAWRTGSTTVAFNIPSVFLSRNHGAIMVRLDPTNRLWPAGQSPLAELGLTYTPADGSAQVSQSLEAAYAGTAPLADDTIFYSQRAVRKSMALVNTALAESQACQIYWNGTGTRDSALALLDQTQTMLRSEATTLEDTDLTTEANNVARLESNMRYSNAGTGGSYTSEQTPTACSFAAGGSGNRSAMVGLLLTGFAAVLRRQRRR
jgi:Ca-activated chloride channel family protein